MRLLLSNIYDYFVNLSLHFVGKHYERIFLGYFHTILTVQVYSAVVITLQLSSLNKLVFFVFLACFIHTSDDEKSFQW